MSYSQLYKFTTYLNKDVDFLKANIREYDMKAGGYNILKNAGVLSNEQIKYLDTLPKDKRKVQIGILQRDNQNINKIVNDGFEIYRQKLFEANNIEDKDILAIKKDAIFVINKPLMNTTFGHVVFDLKNKYTSYCHIDKKELYFTSKGKIDVKGIKDSKLKLHRKGMTKFLVKLFRYIELGDNDKLIKFIRKFAVEYKNKELPIDYYREYNSDSIIRFNMSISDMGFGLCSFRNDNDLDIEDIDISYNYLRIIIPLVRLFFQ